MEAYMWIVWLSLFVLMLVVEAIGTELVSIWFSLGALIALIVSFIPNVPWWVEVVVFVVISCATLFALRPLFTKYFKRNVISTNVDSYTGKKGYVIEDIEYLKPGAVKIGDVAWTAIPVDQKTVIKENEVIEVVAISGNKLILRKVENK